MEENSRPSNGDEPVERFREFLERHKGERHLLIIQDYPDPDAISSALAHRMICEPYGISCEIIYQGEISHPENIALVQVLEIELKRYQAGFDLSEYQGAVFIDTQGPTTSIFHELQEHQFPTLAVIDHHIRTNPIDAEFVDLRNVGATATMFVGYLKAGLLKLETSNSEHAILATALMHGLRTDTNDMVQARTQDFEAAAYLSHYFNPGLLSQILSVKRTKRVMGGIEKALRARRSVDNLTLAGIGYLRRKDRDIIPQVADFLVTEEDVHTVVAYGVVMNEDGSESVVGSLRSTKLTLNPDDFLKECLGADESGRYYGGGRRHAGGFEIPVGFISGSFDEEYDELKWKLIDRKVRQDILGKLGKIDDQKTGANA